MFRFAEIVLLGSRQILPLAEIEKTIMAEHNNDISIKLPDFRKHLLHKNRLISVFQFQFCFNIQILKKLDSMIVFV